MKRGVTKALGALGRFWLDSPTPLLGVEIRAGFVGVVRGRREKGRCVLAGAASVELPVGAVVPSLSEPNIVDSVAVGRALGVAAERAGAADGGIATLVLPDPAVRVAAFGAVDVGKARGRDLLELARFRLRSSVPFDVRDARVAVVRSREEGLPSVAVVGDRSVVGEYEAVLSECRFEAGVVEPAGLALTALLPADGVDGLLVEWDVEHLTIVVVRGDWPLLFRTVVGVATEADEVAHEVRSTLLYCQEKLAGVAPRRIVVRVPPQIDADALLRLETGVGLPVSRAEMPGIGGPSTSAAEVQGFGAALAAVLGRVQ